MRSDFRSKSFNEYKMYNLFVYNLLIGCCEKNEESHPYRFSDKGIKKPRLKFNLGLVLISL